MNRLLRNHVVNVRHKDGRYLVVVKIVAEKDTFVEIEWNRWLKTTDEEKASL